MHWDTLKNEIKSNSVWALLHKDAELEEIDIDETEFQSSFQAEIKQNDSLLSSGGTWSLMSPRDCDSKKGVVKVIDSKRANNG